MCLKFTPFELKTNSPKPNFGHFSLWYVFNYEEYYHIFPVADESTKCERGWDYGYGIADRSRVRTATGYLALSDIAKVQRIHSISGDCKIIDC
jgi:hypothetical protein